VAGGRSLRAKAAAFAAPVSAMAPIGWLSLYLDRYIVGVVVGPAAAGVLAALSGAIVRPYAIVSAALTNFFRPDLLDEVAGRGRQGTLASWIWTALAIGGAAFVGVALVGGWAVRFLLSFDQPVSWGDRLLLVLAASQAIQLVRHAVDNRVLAQGRSGTLLSAQLVAVALGIPLIAAGALLGGPVGAAGGRGANEIVLLLVTLWLTRGPRPIHQEGLTS
jgi:O-antigen/teichoic acid export membrane protein